MAIIPCIIWEHMIRISMSFIMKMCIRWMQSWDSNIRPQGQKWSCMMTLPRELKTKNGKVLQSPIREIEKYYKNPVCYDRKEIKGTCQLDGIDGRVLDMTVEILSGDYREFTICFAQNKNYHTRFTYFKENGEVEIDRTYSGMVGDALASRRVSVKNPADRVNIRIILDRYSAEIFINDGAQVLSTTFYTPQEASEISFECDGSAMTNIKKYEITL